VNKQATWGAVPIAVAKDKRLTANDLRVYIALSSFQGKRAQCFPSRKQIYDRSGVHWSHVSDYTAHLESLGYIDVIQRGKKASNVYRVKSDDAVAATSLQGEDAMTATGEDAAAASSILKQHRKEQRETAQSAVPRPDIQIKARAFLPWFAHEHEQARGGKYSTMPAKEIKLILPHLEQLGEEEVKRRATAFLSSNDPFYEKTGYTIGVFTNQINKFGGTGKGHNGGLLDVKELSMDEPPWL